MYVHILTFPSKEKLEIYGWIISSRRSRLAGFHASRKKEEEEKEGEEEEEKNEDEVTITLLLQYCRCYRVGHLREQQTLFAV